MKGLFSFIALFALAVGLSLAARFNDGYLLLVLPPWRIELSFSLALALFLALLLILHLLLRALLGTLALPRRVRLFRQHRQRSKGMQAFQEALRLLFEGRFGHALKKAEKAHAKSEAPALAALIAARAAQRLREPEKQQLWLQRAAEADAGSEAARLMLEAEIAVEARQFAAALEALQRLQQINGRHIAALRLELRAQQGLEQWDEVLRIAALLEKRRALSPETLREVKLAAHRNNLQARQDDRALFSAYLERIPASEFKEFDHRLSNMAAATLVALGAQSEARRFIERAIERDWDSRLAELYGRGTTADSPDNVARIARAEGWLTKHPHDAALLLTLGRLCLSQQLWGKAQSYLEAALSLGEKRDVHLELARLADRLGDESKANHHYRAAAELAPDTALPESNAPGRR